MIGPPGLDTVQTTPEAMSEPVLQGGCLCGAIRYRFLGAASSSSTCFCKSCRRASGAPAVSWFVGKLTQLTWLAGQPTPYRSSELVIRTFCNTCGTPLSYQHRARPDDIELTTATLDQPEAMPPSEEIWLSHKVAWAVSDSRLRHFSEENPDD